MILKWFDASEAKEFGISLAQDLLKQDDPAKSKRAKPSQKKNHDALLKFLDRIAKFKLQHNLNIYKKAQLGNAFEWKLIEGGYDPKYAKSITTSLLIKL
ncbi:hypothetical protein [Dechloromonas sp. A34]|uniref:hypothetical protein n=1 Tax=Dechloromonas sp. A34 TaxID=447588 RepID=UPI00224896F9|nr:hypothetical protein [Dechloromonas sp. A34]